jgi:hypothetical protein
MFKKEILNNLNNSLKLNSRSGLKVINSERKLKLSEIKSNMDLVYLNKINNKIGNKTGIFVGEEIQSYNRNNTNYLKFNRVRPLDIGSKIRPHNYIWSWEHLNNQEYNINIKHQEKVKKYFKEESKNIRAVASLTEAKVKEILS